MAHDQYDVVGVGIAGCFAAAGFERWVAQRNRIDQAFYDDLGLAPSEHKY
ncbi:hypothetical protein [Natronolimnobius baerhuensis]|nr:hypothetical protein [Natronolimnobius baerhuensis]